MRSTRFRASISQRLLLLLTIIVNHGASDAESTAQDRINIYLRGDYRNAQPGIVTLNGVYDFVSEWGTLEIAARVGTFTNQPGIWSYKLEGITPEFWEGHRFAARVVKNDIYQPTGTSQDTRIAQRLMGVYRPFKGWNALKEASVNMDLGLAEQFSGVSGANVLPNGNGAFNLFPIWALKLDLPSPERGRHYVLSYSNFDIFDPYPASQPFIQLEFKQEIDAVTYYTYMRYRWDYTVDRFYSLYLTFGAEIPN